MKSFYLLFIAVFTCAVSFAQSSISLKVSNGPWSTDTSWNKGRTPSDGDEVVVPANSTVVISKKLVLKNVHVRVFGTVSLDGNTTVDLDNQSDIVIYDGGKIEKTDPNGKIKINGSNIFPGNSSSIAGPVTATAVSAGFANFILPVRFVGFSVAQGNNGNLIQWSTSEEHNSGSFEVERSLDGATWNTVSTVNAAGNSSALTNYSYTDKASAGQVVYYRVKQVDLDGNYVYTAIKCIKGITTGLADVKVASAQNKVVLQFSQPIKGGVSVRLVSLNGTVVSEQKLDHAIGQVVLNTSVKGHFVVSVSNGQDISVARQVIL